MLAHSAKSEKQIYAQRYGEHVRNVQALAVEHALVATQFAKRDQNAFVETVRQSAIFHDLGKLDLKNQDVLAGRKRARNLPVQHTEAGTAFLLKKNSLASVLVRSHHIGLPNMAEERIRGESCFRDTDPCIRQLIDKTLDQLARAHDSELECYKLKPTTPLQPKFDSPHINVLLRLALSCLVDADHTDTAAHYGDEHAKAQPPALKPKQRLDKLNQYVASLSSTPIEASQNTKNALRQKMYLSCSNAKPNASIISCDSPVGSGKTTAVMAHLLSQAYIRKLRRIIVVLPFTNIIKQSVEVYRKALVLDDENPEEVVAELHHQADFESIQTRYLTSVWKAPIVVTTAVNFFETLASNKTSSMRKLHQLPGSAVFIDESHAALPTKLMPLAWQWINVLALEWGCYWLLASGSQCEYWKLDEIRGNWPENIPQLVDKQLRHELSTHETSRIAYQIADAPMNEIELSDFLQKLNGPVLCIVNTVQSAAVIALRYKQKWGEDKVEHLSTALTPEDRDTTLERIKVRLKNPDDNCWVLVATSCVEAGVNLSFKTGVRELASLNSLVQTSGRVNRNATDQCADVWTFKLKQEGLLKLHPMLKESRWVLSKFFKNSQETPISSDLCTKALSMEILRSGKAIDAMLTAEQSMNFPEVEQKFKVIDADTRLVVIDSNLAKALMYKKAVDWKDLQRKSVQLWGYKIKDLGLKEISGHENLYTWGDWGYDEFIGCMKGILELEQFSKDGGGIL